MKILEYGDSKKNKIILIHGFQMHIDSLKVYIDAFKKNYFVIVPVLPGHNPDYNCKYEFCNRRPKATEW